MHINTPVTIGDQGLFVCSFQITPPNELNHAS